MRVCGAYRRPIWIWTGSDAGTSWVKLTSSDSSVLLERDIQTFMNNYNTKQLIKLYILTFGICKKNYLFERIILCSASLHLFDQKYSKTVILWNITISNKYFLFENVIYFYDGTAEFSAIFSVTQSFRNHSITLIWWSRNISYYYQCWKQLWFLVFLRIRDTLFQDFDEQS